MTCEGILNTEQMGGKGMGCWRGPAGHLLQQLPDHVLVAPQGLLPLLHILCTAQRVGYMPCKAKCASSTTVGALQIYTVQAKLLQVPETCFICSAAQHLGIMTVHAAGDAQKVASKWELHGWWVLLLDFTGFAILVSGRLHVWCSLQQLFVVFVAGAVRV